MKNPFKLLIPGLLAVTLLSLTVDAQTTPYPFLDLATSKASVVSHPVAKGADPRQASKAPITVECDSVAATAEKMAKKAEMQSKLEGMDANLDRLAAQMNNFAGYRDVGSNEEPMVAVINELVAQQKAFRAMVSEMHSEMMASSMRPMDCSMMSADKKPSR